MKEINYQLEFFSNWHCGSGLAAGADVDLLVVKDRNGLPFVPGKTIKGLVREAVEDVLTFSGESREIVVQIFGNSEERDNAGNKANAKGNCFFSNAELSEQEATAIVTNNLTDHLFLSVASTAIDENGIAKKHSLRKMQVAIPCTLEGRIICNTEFTDEQVMVIEKGLKLIKRLGQNRNRGLGRCEFSIKKGGSK